MRPFQILVFPLWVMSGDGVGVASLQSLEQLLAFSPASLLQTLSLLHTALPPIETVTSLDPWGSKKAASYPSETYGALILILPLFPTEPGSNTNVSFISPRAFRISPLYAPWLTSRYFSGITSYLYS